MPTEEKSCTNCGFNGSKDAYIAMCHNPKPCNDKCGWLPKGSIDVEIEINMARKNEIELELERAAEYLSKVDKALNDEIPKTPNQIREAFGIDPIEKVIESSKYSSKATVDVGERKCVDCYHRSASGVCVERCINKDKWILNNAVNTKSVLQDSGERTDFGTGAVRDMHAGKGRCDLLPPAALLRLARHFENGAKKYGDRNWELGIPCHSFADSAHRHYLQYMDGATNEDHLMAAIWNLMCLAETEEKRPEMMDIPSRMNKKKVDPKDTANYTAMNILQNLNDVTFSWDLASAKDKAVNILKQVDRPTVTVELSADELALINRYKSGEFEEALRRINETREEINRKKEKYNESR